MVINVEIVHVSHKTRLVLNGIVVYENDVLECSCSDYLNCADVCELLFLKTVILARLLDYRLTVIKIHISL